MDVAIIDTPWNGVWQSMKIAAAAEACEVNVAPHNFYGHLCTMMNAHFSAAVPNLRIMETDIDRLAWDHELFTHVPEIVDGHLIMPDRPGWGTEPNEEALRAHPPKDKGGLLTYGQKNYARRLARGYSFDTTSFSDSEASIEATMIAATAESPNA